MSNTIKYRPEIDGLRALAVVPVILFHAGLDAFKGGFVGVDIFFVISGYLITSIIVKDIEAGTFSFRGFYNRRARRILPALFVVVLCSIPFAWWLMLPTNMKAFSSSLISVSLFASNILFWRQSGYFDQAAELKPLLHTWSLAVEEQYYIVFPIAVLVLWRLGRRNVVWAIGIVAITGLVASEYASRHHPSFDFYWLPTRAWELMAGALCSFAAVTPIVVRDNVLSGAGLAAIVLSIFVFDSKVPFPSIYALVPVLGACLIILFANKGTLTHRALSIRPVVGLGLISYSSYLWHQPILSFFRHYSMNKPDSETAIILCLFAILMAYLSWRFVENPLRHSRSINGSLVFGGAVTCSVVIAIFGIVGNFTDGFPRRFIYDEQTRNFINTYENSLPDWHYLRKEEILEKYGDNCSFFKTEDYRNGKSTNAPRSSIDTSCFTRSFGKPYAVFIWGDSHAQMVRYGLKRSLPSTWDILQVASEGCAPSIRKEDNSGKEYCDYSNEFARAAIKRIKPEVVVLGQVNGHDPNKLREVANFLLNSGVKKVIIDGPTPQWNYDLPWIIIKQYWNSRQDRTVHGLKREIFAIDAVLKREFISIKSVKYVSLIDIFCNTSGCLMYLDGDQEEGLVSWDYGHLTPRASLFLAENGLSEAITFGFE